MSTDNDNGDGDGFGLDKVARLQARREADDSEVEPLEPPFPWNAEPFDPGFFGLAYQQESASASADAAT
jgi:hypothetical protein